MNMRFALAPWLLAALLACGPAPPDAGEEAAAGEAEEAAVPIAGLYKVSGSTVGIASGNKRAISGTVILSEEGERYTATFNLTTTYPGRDQVMPAEVIGKGEGDIDGRKLTGQAETQLVMATVPGVDPGFAFMPKMVSTRIHSSTVATVAADGTVSIDIESKGVGGADYEPTRTTLRGDRISASGVEGATE